MSRSRFSSVVSGRSGAPGGRGLWLSALGALVAALVGIGLVPAGSSAASSSPWCGTDGVFSTSGSTGTCTYATGGEHTFTVPSYASAITAEAIGAAGAPGEGVSSSCGDASGGTTGGAGGLGADVTGTLSVSASSTLYVEVGSDSGGVLPGSNGGGEGGLGFNSGGEPECLGDGGGGGGASDVQTTPASSSVLTASPGDPRLIVAGGGGGGGGGGTLSGASGGKGGPSGGSASGGAGAGGESTLVGGCFSDGGAAGASGSEGMTGSGGGSAGQASPACTGESFNGAAGKAGVGGAGADTSTKTVAGTAGGGGGGGGGYVGGGAGAVESSNGQTSGPGGGGGGSSYGPAGTTFATASANATPKVAISWTLQPLTVDLTGSQTYGSSDPSFATASSPPSGDSFSGTARCTTVNHGTSIGATLAAGSYMIDGSSCSGVILTGPTASDYHITYTGSTFTVNPAAVTVSGPSASAYFGAVPSSFTPTYTGLVNSQTAPSSPATCTSNATSTSPPGQYPINCSGATDNNYKITYAAGALTIAQAPTKVAAGAANEGSGSFTFYAVLTRGDTGGALTGQAVVFAVQSQTACQATANSAGMASCTATVPVGAASFTASYTGDSDFAASSVTGSLPSTSTNSALVTPSNAFSVVSEKISNTGAIALGVRTHAPGSISGIATFTESIKRTTGKGKHRQTHTTHKTVTYGTATATSNGTAVADMTITPTGSAAKLLEKLKTLHLKLSLSFTPTDGSLNTQVMPSTVKAPKARTHEPKE